MPRLPFLDRSNRIVSSRAAWGGAKNLRIQEGRYRGDDFIEWAFSKQGKENIALVALTAGCIAGIFLIGRYA